MNTTCIGGRQVPPKCAQPKDDLWGCTGRLLAQRQMQEGMTLQETLIPSQPLILQVLSVHMWLLY